MKFSPHRRFLRKFRICVAAPHSQHHVSRHCSGGRLHNDDPDAAMMWMKEGSYWTQPASEVHITAARGSSIAYVEIQSGPYLVKPAEDAFDRCEKPINIDASNTVWLDAANTSWITTNENSANAAGPEMAFLWGDPNGEKINGTMLKSPAGFSGTINSSSETFRAVVIKGSTNLKLADEVKALTPESYFGSQGEAVHEISCDEESLVYIRAKGKYTIK